MDEANERALDLKYDCLLRVTISSLPNESENHFKTLPYYVLDSSNGRRKQTGHCPRAYRLAVETVLLGNGL